MMSIGAQQTVAERLRVSRAEMIVIVAPAGYGKSTIAEDVARRSARRATCVALRDPAAFALRVLEALQAESPERRLAIAESSASVEAPVTTRALEFWSTTVDGSSVFVIDNVEDILETPAGTQLLAELLRRRARGRRVVLCSRRPLPAGILRFVSPDRTEFIDARSLALSPSDIDRLLTASGLSNEFGPAISRLTDGWPIAVMLMIRLAREGVFDARTQPTDERYETLLDHLSREYLEALPDALVDALIFVAAVPGTTIADMAAWLSLGRRALHEFFNSCPFVRNSDDGFVSHPLLIALVSTRYADRAAKLRVDAIDAYRRAGRYLRAAELEIGFDAFAEAAADLALETRTSGRYGIGESDSFVALASAVGRESWLRFPELWLSMLQLRRFALAGDDLIGEATRVYSSLRPNDPQQLRVNVAERYAIVLINYGRASEVDALIDDCLGFVSDASLVRRLEIDRLGAATHAGAYLAAQEAFRSAAASALADPTFYGPKLDFIEATIALRRGSYERGVALLEESVRIARRSGLTSSLQVTLSNLVLEAWLAGDDARFRSALAELSASLLPGLEKPWTFLIDAAARPDDAVPTGYEFASVRCVAHLMIAVGGARAKAIQHAELAVREADASADIALRVVARVALAEIAPVQRARSVAEALDLASRIDLPEIAEGVAAFDRGDEAGVFGSFVRSRLRHRRSIASIVLRMSAQKAVRDGERVALTTVEYALLLLLATARRALPRATLCDSLWPDADLDAAEANLKVWVHRVRKKLGADVVARAGDTYLIGSHVTLDLHAAEALVASAGRGSLSPERAHELATILTDFESSSVTRMDRYDWYLALCRRSADVARSAALLLVRSGGRVDDRGFRFLRDLVREDPCDEEVCDVVIRTLARAGQFHEARTVLDSFVREAASADDTFALRRGVELSALIVPSAGVAASVVT